MIAIGILFVSLLGLGLSAAAIAVVWARAADIWEARRRRQNKRAVEDATGRDL